MPSCRHEALLTEYRELASTFRMLTDIRFKLLAFLPFVAGAAATLLTRDTSGPQKLAFSLFGAVVTIGLVTYNTRNDQLYDTLVGRAAAIERSLGIPDGTFANRPRPWLSLLGGSWKVDHRTAVATIYEASIAIWLLGVVLGAGETLNESWSEQRTPAWFELMSLGVAVGLVALGTWRVRRERATTEDGLRVAAYRAVHAAIGLEPSDLRDSQEFGAACASLAGSSKAALDSRIIFVARLSSDGLAYYITSGCDEWRAAQTVALVTDFPPEWLFDCATQRRRAIAPKEPPSHAHHAPH